MGEGVFAKCLCYYISLCSKLVYGGGRGVKNLQNPVFVVYEQPHSENPKFFLLSHIPCRMHRPCFFRPFSQTNVLTHLRVEISLTKKLLLELFFPREERTWPMIPFRKVNLIGRFREWISKKNYHSSSKRNLLIFDKLFFSQNHVNSKKFRRA